MRSRLPRFVASRVVGSLLILFGITLVTFVLTQAVPADPALANLGMNATEDQIQSYRAAHGLDDPLPVRFGRYLVALGHGDLGTSQHTHNPVLADLGSFVSATTELALVALLMAVVLGISFGVLSAVFRDRWPDYLLRFVSLSGISFPLFWLALVLLYLLFYKAGTFPGGGRLDPAVSAPPNRTGLYTVDALVAGDWTAFGDALRHLVLPAYVLAVSSIALLTRYTRAAVLDVIDQDYVRAARAQGLSEPTVIGRHVLRAALPAVITVVGLLFANVLAGTVLVENVFSWPGIGSYGFQAATALDLPAITGVSLFVALVYLVVNFVVDLLYGYLDPRIRVS
ncbi:ABC transporter permease [Pseudonocardia acaciae]|uniref:ABC transporter permease n=1 Tax=Pseudonocardia acaciae TaxID=551276 RepID=UPI000B0A0FF3|nr:ABC transporter permease [Pseudonocardia acaciae]